MRNSYLKLNHPFQKISNRQNLLTFIGPAIWNRIPEILKKIKNLNTFKHNMKHFYLNDLSDPNLWNTGCFDYVMATIIKDHLFFIKYFYIFFLLYSDWRTTMKIRLITNFVLSLIFFSVILLLTTLFVCCFLFLFVCIHFCIYLDLFLW